MNRRVLLGALAAGAAGTQSAGAAFGPGTRLFQIRGNSVLITVRGVASAGNPWWARNGSVALLDPEGNLFIRIRGLVVAAGLTAAGSPVNPAFVNTNPVATVRIAVSWIAPPASGGPVVFQETPPLPLDAAGDLTFRGNIGAPPPGAERPVLLVRAGGTPGTGPFIGSSDFVADWGTRIG